MCVGWTCVCVRACVRVCYVAFNNLNQSYHDGLRKMKAQSFRIMLRNPLKSMYFASTVANNPVTIKAEPGRRVRFLSIGRSVEVGEKIVRYGGHSHNQKCPGWQLADLPANGVEFLAHLSAVVRQELVRCLPVSLRYPCGIRQGAVQFLQAVRCPASHTSGGRRANFWTTQTIHISAVRHQVGRTQGGVWSAPGRCLADKWIV